MADNFFAFSRGDVLVATTNQNSGQVNYQVTYNPFSEGEKVCNIFYTSDCVTVQNGAVNVVLNNGEAKVYVP